MTIDETIKILKELERISYTPQRFYTVDAIKLGIEALKRIKEIRQYCGFVVTGSPNLGYVLPGETKEE